MKERGFFTPQFWISKETLPTSASEEGLMVNSIIWQGHMGTEAHRLKRELETMHGAALSQWLL